jgi:hypothetical protein
LRTKFEIKDSGERKQFKSGMVRDTAEDKIDFLNIRFGPMFRRWAEHLTKAKTKYPDISLGVPNWTLATGEAELQRFRESFARHAESWLAGEIDEDHAAGMFFNINGAEYVKAKLMSPTCERHGKLAGGASYIPVGECRIKSPDDNWYCKLKEGHGGLHEAPGYTEPWCDPA